MGSGAQEWSMMTLQGTNHKNVPIGSPSVAAVQSESGAVQVETQCQLVLNKFTLVQLGHYWPIRVQDLGFEM